jgi:hypothetical protein
MLPLTCFLLTVPSLQWRVFKALFAPFTVVLAPPAPATPPPPVTTQPTPSPAFPGLVTNDD